MKRQKWIDTISLAAWGVYLLFTITLWDKVSFLIGMIFFYILVCLLMWRVDFTDKHSDFQDRTIKSLFEMYNKHRGLCKGERKSK